MTPYFFGGEKKETQLLVRIYTKKRGKKLTAFYILLTTHRAPPPLPPQRNQRHTPCLEGKGGWRGIVCGKSWELGEIGNWTKCEVHTEKIKYNAFGSSYFFYWIEMDGEKLGGTTTTSPTTKGREKKVICEKKIWREDDDNVDGHVSACLSVSTLLLLMAYCFFYSGEKGIDVLVLVLMLPGLWKQHNFSLWFGNGKKDGKKRKKNEMLMWNFFAILLLLLLDAGWYGLVQKIKMQSRVAFVAGK